MQLILTLLYSVLTERCHYVILTLGALSHPPVLCLYYVNVWRVSPGGRGPKNVSVSGQTQGAANFQAHAGSHSPGHLRHRVSLSISSPRR